MKIIRFISEDNRIYFGATDRENDTEAWIIDEAAPTGFRLTEKRAVIVQYLPPVTPEAIIGIGLNYRRHADETGVSHPDSPVMFFKGINSVTGHRSPIVLPAAGPEEVDYEAELAVIIGKTAFNVAPEDAMNYVLGYCCANDVSARDWQIRKQKGQWARGKSFDTFCPLGPWLVSRDEIADPNRLMIETYINGQVFQSSNTSDMIFSVPELISDLSRSMTLSPGTVILTGTPEGVGFTRKPPVFLKPGDTVTIVIEGVGALTNTVIRE